MNAQYSLTDRVGATADSNALWVLARVCTVGELIKIYAQRLRLERTGQKPKRGEHGDGNAHVVDFHFHVDITIADIPDDGPLTLILILVLVLGLTLGLALVLILVLVLILMSLRATGRVGTVNGPTTSSEHAIHLLTVACMV
jgi:hypothetical protein